MEGKEAKGRGGRPPKAPEDRRRNNLTIRIRDDTRAALEQSAAANGRSLAVESELRLEQSVRAEGVIREAFDLALGQRLAALVLILARVMLETGSHAGFAKSSRRASHGEWLNDPYAYDQMTKAVDRVLGALKPEGEIAAPKRTVTSPGIDADKMFESLGAGFARSFLEAVVSNDLSTERGQWAAPIRERLGLEAIERIGDFLRRGAGFYG